MVSVASPISLTRHSTSVSTLVTVPQNLKIVNGAGTERVLQTVISQFGPNFRFESFKFLGHIPFSYFLGYMTSLTWIKSLSSLALVLFYVGWVDMKTGDPVDDKDVHGKYEKAIMSHAGVRFFSELLLVLALFCLMPSDLMRTVPNDPTRPDLSAIKSSVNSSFSSLITSRLPLLVSSLSTLFFL